VQSVTLISLNPYGSISHAVTILYLCVFLCTVFVFFRASLGFTLFWCRTTRPIQCSGECVLRRCLLVTW